MASVRYIEFIMDDKEILEVNETSLDEWLELLRKPPTRKIFVRNMFPTKAHRNEWFQTAHLRPESDIKLLLRHFLVSAGSNPMDGLDARFLISRLHDSAAVDELGEHDRRLLLYAHSRGEYPVWEGLGWVIDLLPQCPRMALNVIDAFFHAYYARLRTTICPAYLMPKQLFATAISKVLTRQTALHECCSVLIGVS